MMDDGEEYMVDGDAAETAKGLPVFPDGSPVRPGDKVRLPDGAIVVVRAVAVTGEGAFVSDKPISPDSKLFFPVGAVVGSPDDDSAEALDADMALAPAAYCRRRAIEVTAEQEGGKLMAMIADIRRRQAALDAGRGFRAGD